MISVKWRLDYEERETLAPANMHLVHVSFVVPPLCGQRLKHRNLRGTCAREEQGQKLGQAAVAVAIINGVESRRTAELIPSLRHQATLPITAPINLGTSHGRDLPRKRTQ